MRSTPQRSDTYTRNPTRCRGSCRSRRSPAAPGDWALALEAFRLSKGGAQITESPDDIELAGTVIQGRHRDGRPLYVRYRDLTVIPIWRLQNEPNLLEQLRGKAVFIGVTALSGARDRLTTPRGETISGLEIHANAYATLAEGRFLTPVSRPVVLLTCILLVAAAGSAFAFLTGWPAYLTAAAVIFTSHAIPHLAFQRGYVFAYAAPVAAAWLASGAAAGWQYFVVRRQLRKSESDKARYQQAIHFVTHEMRSPLTAIQGSSEMMGRYNLNEEKRKQIAEMINSESKRLARMIQTFLDIERLTEGETEIRTEPFELDGAGAIAAWAGRGCSPTARRSPSRPGPSRQRPSRAIAS